MVVLGLDPSFTATGFAIIKQESNKQILMQFGFLQLAKETRLSDRIGLFYDQLGLKIATHNVTKISIETPFLGKNAQTFLKLGYLRGVLHLLAYQHNLEVQEFAPREVKLAITGFGGAEKEQVSRMIHMLFPNLPQQKSHDVTDAIAISLCGAWAKSPQSMHKL